MLSSEGEAQEVFESLLDIFDTELHMEIGQIRRYLSEKRNLPNVILLYKGRILYQFRDKWTLRDYGWVDGACGTINVIDKKSSNLNFILFLCGHHFPRLSRHFIQYRKNYLIGSMAISAYILLKYY